MESSWRDEEDTAAEETFHWQPDHGSDADLRLLAERIEFLLRSWRIPLRGVGVALPATCDEVGAVRVWPGRQSWTGINVTAFFERVFTGTPMAFADDGDLAALAEARAGRWDNLLYLGVGTGIGGGIVHNGSLWPGSTRGSCEVGHIVVDRGGVPCECGRFGCVQAMASGPATLRRAAWLSGRNIAFNELVAGARARESWALEAIGESAAALASAVVSICELAHPDAVVLGGGFAAGIQAYVDAVRFHAARLARPGSNPIPIRPAMLSARSSLQGAIMLAELTDTTATTAQTRQSLRSPSISSECDHGVS